MVPFSHRMRWLSHVRLPGESGLWRIGLAQERIAKYREYLIANAQLEVGFARARPPAMPAIRSEEPAVWQSIVLGEQTAEEALKAFAETMREMIAMN